MATNTQTPNTENTAANRLDKQARLIGWPIIILSLLSDQTENLLTNCVISLDDWIKVYATTKDPYQKTVCLKQIETFSLQSKFQQKALSHLPNYKINLPDHPQLQAIFRKKIQETDLSFYSWIDFYGECGWWCNEQLMIEKIFSKAENFSQYLIFLETVAPQEPETINCFKKIVLFLNDNPNIENLLKTLKLADSFTKIKVSGQIKKEALKTRAQLIELLRNQIDEVAEFKDLLYFDCMFTKSLPDLLAATLNDAIINSLDKRVVLFYDWSQTRTEADNLNASRKLLDSLYYKMWETARSFAEWVKVLEITSKPILKVKIFTQMRKIARGLEEKKLLCQYWKKLPDKITCLDISSDDITEERDRAGINLIREILLTNDHKDLIYLYGEYPERRYLEKMELLSAKFDDWLEVMNLTNNIEHQELIFAQMVKSAKTFAQWNQLIRLTTKEAKPVYLYSLADSYAQSVIDRNLLKSFEDLPQKYCQEYLETCLAALHISDFTKDDCLTTLARKNIKSICASGADTDVWNSCEFWKNQYDHGGNLVAKVAWENLYRLLSAEIS